MKISEFRWYPAAHSHENAQELRRGGIAGPLYASAAQRNDSSWVATVSLHRPDREQMECESELEAILAAESWLDELIADAAPP